MHGKMINSVVFLDEEGRSKKQEGMVFVTWVVVHAVGLKIGNMY